MQVFVTEGHTRMSDGYGPLPEVLGRLAQARGTGTAADGLVRVEVDGTGDVVDLVLEPRAMRLASVDLAAAVREAFRTARAMAGEALRDSVPQAVAGLGEVGSTLSDLQLDAQRRLGELTSIAQELSSRLDRLT